MGYMYSFNLSFVVPSKADKLKYSNQEWFTSPTFTELDSRPMQSLIHYLRMRVYLCICVCKG